MWSAMTAYSSQVVDSSWARKHLVCSSCVQTRQGSQEALGYHTLLTSERMHWHVQLDRITTAELEQPALQRDLLAQEQKVTRDWQTSPACAMADGQAASLVNVPEHIRASAEVAPWCKVQHTLSQCGAPQSSDCPTQAAAEAQLRAVRALVLADEAGRAQGDASIRRYATNARLMGEVFGCQRQYETGASAPRTCFRASFLCLKLANMQESFARYFSRPGQLMNPKLLQRAQDQRTPCRPA